MRRSTIYRLTFVLLAACDRSTPSSPLVVDASVGVTAAATSLADAAAATAAKSTDGGARVERTYLTFNATIGKKGDARIALAIAGGTGVDGTPERSEGSVAPPTTRGGGTKNEGFVTLGAEALVVRGELKEGKKLSFAEVVGKGE